MKYDVETFVTDYQGKVVELGQDKEMFTYRRMIGGLLQITDPNAPDTADTKGKLHALLTKVYAQKEPEFTAAEITLINDRAGRYGTPLEMGRLKEFLEPDVKA